MDRRRLVYRTLFVAGVLITVLFIGTVGFTTIENWPIFDAFYMTLTTITSVGYQEIKPLSQTGRIFNSFVILFGVSAMFFAVGAMTQTIIELQIADRYGRRRRSRMISQLSGHFLVCGFGRVGRNASYELQRVKAPFLVIDRSEQRVARALEAGMLAVVADATNDDDLKNAGVLQARGLIAALPSDAENLFIILSAKTLNSKLVVATRASEEQNEEKLRRAGADTVFTPYTMAGRRLADSLLRPHVIEFLDIATGGFGPKITMEQVYVASDGPKDSRTLGDLLTTTQSNVIVVALRDSQGRMKFNPSRDTRIGRGDFLIVLGDRPSLDVLENSVTKS
jgi:voltage-gated potassium channel